MREKRDVYGFLVGKPAGEDGRIILKWAVKKQDGTGFMPVRIGTSGGLLCAQQYNLYDQYALHYSNI